MPLTLETGASGGSVKLYDPNKTNTVRRPKKGDYLARQLCKQFKGLPKGVNHHLQMLDTFNAAYPALGITPNAARLYVYLFKRTQDHDWHKNRMAIVWPSNEKIINDLNICDESALKKLFRQLRDIGLIAYKDSPTRKRYGQRNDKGIIIYAKTFGIVLNSIAGLYEKLKSIAEAHQIKVNFQKKIKRAVTIYRRERDELLTTALELIAPQDHRAAIERFSALDTQIAASGRDYLLKEQILEQYRLELDSLDSLIIEAAQFEANVEPIALDETLAHMQQYEVKLPPTRGNNHPSIRTITAKPFTDSNRLSDESKDETEPKNAPKGFAAKQLAKIKAIEADSKKISKPGPKKHDYVGAKISFEQVKTALPSNLRKLIREDYGFFELYDLLRADARDLFITAQLFDEARLLMGIENTCACYAKILSMGETLRSPSGYFKGMMSKYSDGALRIERSLFGIIAESKKTKSLCADLFADA